MPCFEVFFDPPPGLEMVFITVFVVKHLGCLGLGLATLVLLLLPGRPAVLSTGR